MLVKGTIHLKIKQKNKIKLIKFSNHVTLKGLENLINLLLNEQAFAIKEVVFGDGGTNKGKPKEIGDSLYGTIRLTKDVIIQKDPEDFRQLIILINISKQEANGQILNEMGLRLSNGDYFSLATFPDIHKEKDMSLTWIWIIAFHGV